MKNLIKGSLNTGIQKSYDIGAQLGTGKFSVVKSATEKSSGKQWAIKIMRKSVVEEQNLIKEVEIMLDIKHQNIIALKEIYETDTDLALVLELVTGGELFDKIVERNSYTEEDASKLVNTLIKVISYLHSKDIVHCDLKPENLLYSDNSENAVIKLCDFGLSQRCAAGEQLRSMIGTATYMAPEISAFTGYGKPVDMWALGVIIYILLCGFPPFDETTGWNLEFPSPEWDNISDSAKDLIKSLLVVDPAKRLTAQQAMKNVWISGVNTGKQSIIGTLKTLREFNTLRRTGTTMGHNKTPSRSSVFELFPSLTPSTPTTTNVTSTATSTNNVEPTPTKIEKLDFTKNLEEESRFNKTFENENYSDVESPICNNNNNNSNSNNNNSNNNNISSSNNSVELNIGEIQNQRLNSVRICNSNSSSSSSLLKELDQETTVFQAILKKQLMSSLENTTASGGDSSMGDLSSDTSTLSDNERVVSPDMLSTASGDGGIFVESNERQTLLEQLRQEREMSARLRLELSEARKSSFKQQPTESFTSININSSSNSNSYTASGQLSLSIPLSAGGSNNNSDNEATNKSDKKDKSKYGVDRIIQDLQSDIEKLHLPKETNDKLNNLMLTYRLKNQEKSVKLQLERQKEKYKKLKSQLKKIQK
ncbi:putative protein kinase [Heterostelium album PN500]|uniref:non-specific serine/threonine protein kinase n=1 Tax=Heterostelium pallidum (strain ATCC 26659 / Pp 5 / PN500) TaxID=670386 RepID=D3AVR4_HETP5|nr:putative protein kinase [Heterostelium album PN500]EFA86387.1 putative protein kinase [Heterostelium album PN500]|eukprot:XP_020438492.1 putative protein kinase [Heterostelium album PN500]